MAPGSLCCGSQEMQLMSFHVLRPVADRCLAVSPRELWSSQPEGPPLSSCLPSACGDHLPSHSLCMTRVHPPLVVTSFPRLQGSCLRGACCLPTPQALVALFFVEKNQRQRSKCTLELAVAAQPASEPSVFLRLRCCEDGPFEPVPSDPGQETPVTCM